jgi:hypothetical protein
MLYNGTDVLSEIIPYKKIDTIKDTIQKGDLNAIMDTFDTLKEDTRLLQNLKNLHDVTITYMSKVYPDDSNQTSESAIMP